MRRSQSHNIVSRLRCERLDPVIAGIVLQTCNTTRWDAPNQTGPGCRVQSLGSSVDLLAHHQLESCMKGQMAAVKREYFGRPWQEKNIKHQTREETDEEWDNLNQELLEILKKELQLKAHSSDSSLKEQLSTFSSEKERLLKKIEELETRTGKTTFNEAASFEQ
ncbi:hypothetical protein NDU88_006013 [Pleurodeles waltl]|uniref:Uncharacterized protein n=1 Tax=Pleurodeles waltl TaxID=8319 RepID=A0AAV7UND9_PLEWA|nr:hypothetical protein NDU88_006013 [Pleurodeles waltl]